MQVWHRKDRNEPANVYMFSLYYIEPSAVGRSIYAIGHRELPGALRTFKIERIERVDLISKKYQIPADFEPRELLAVYRD